MTVDSYPLTLETPLEISNVTYLWCNDGWCYIPEMKLRKKYFMACNLQLNIVEESWDGIIQVPEYSEQVEISVYSQSPRIWKETIENLSELYVESKEIQTKNKKSRARQQSLQD